MGRAPCCDNSLVKKGPWSPEEDAMLKAYIDSHGTGGNWIALPQKIGLKRCGKSCRLRWLNYLRPNIKHGGFSDEEDNIICSLYVSIGSRWSVIAAQLPGRTDNDIKNYWNTKLKKKLLGRRKQSLTSSSSSSSMTDATSDERQRLSNSALERLQLHIQLQSSPNHCIGPTLWPKLLHPAQERMIQNLTAVTNDNNTPYLQNQNNFPKLETHAKKGNQKFDEFVGATSNQMNSTMDNRLELDQLIGTPSTLSSLQLLTEFDDFIKTTHSDRREDSETQGGLWRSSEMDTMSSVSLSSEDSNSAIASSRYMMMFHDYQLGYNM